MYETNVLRVFNGISKDTGLDLLLECERALMELLIDAHFRLIAIV